MIQILASIIFLVVLFGLGLADAQTIEGLPPLDALQNMEWRTASNTDENTPSDDGDTTGASSSTARTTGVRKQQAIAVSDALAQAEFEAQQTNEPTFIEQILPLGSQSVQRSVLLKNGDRAAIIAWIDTPDVKTIFRSLKEALLNSFTPEQRDLKDEIEYRNGYPPRNILTFFDPGISNERVLFVRVRQRLYEFRIVDGFERDVDGLVEVLTE